MSKLSNKPNTVKNGHLAPKLQPIQNHKFSKNRFHTPNIMNHMGCADGSVCFFLGEHLKVLGAGTKILGRVEKI